MTIQFNSAFLLKKCRINFNDNEICCCTVLMETPNCSAISL